MTTENFDRKKVAETENTKMFRSRFDIFVLNALADESCEGYGYDVVNYIQNKTKGHYKIKTFSTVYNTLKRLEEQNLVISHKGGGESNGASRVYYSLTEEGRQYLERDKVEYKYLRTLLDNLLTDEDFDLDKEEIPYSASTLKPLTKRGNKATESTQVVNYTQTDVNVEDPQDVEEIVVESSSVVNDCDTNLSTISQTLPNNQSAENVITRSTLIKNPREENNNAYKLVMEKITKPVFDTQKATRREQKVKNVSIQSPVVARKETTQQQAVTQSNRDAMLAAKVTTKDTNVPPKTTANQRTKLEEYNSVLRNEGYTLRTYNSSSVTANNSGNTPLVSTKYVFINKILRDSMVLSALFCIITLLVLYLTRTVFEFPTSALIAIGAVAVAIALVGVIIWFQKPDKRKKDNVNVKALNAITIAIFLVVVMLDLIISLLIPNGYSLNSPKVYAPAIVATTIPFFGLVFTLLYKSGNYFKK